MKRGGKNKTLLLDIYFTPCTKINSKWIIGWNVGAKAINLLEENTEANFLTLWLGKVFLGEHQNIDKRKI